MITFLEKRSMKVVAPSISTCGVGLSTPLCLVFPSSSGGISEDGLIVSILLPISCSHMLVILASHPSHNYTIIPELYASHWACGILNENNGPAVQLISGLWDFKHVHPSSRLYGLIWLTCTSGSWPRAKLSIYWSHIASFLLSATWPIQWQSLPCMVMGAASWGSPSLLGCSAAIKVLIVLQSMSAHICCNSLCSSHIETMETMCNESALGITQRYWLEIWAFGHCKTTMGLSGNRLSSISSNVAISARIPIDCNARSNSAILFHWARYRES